MNFQGAEVLLCLKRKGVFLLEFPVLNLVTEGLSFCILYCRCSALMWIIFIVILFLSVLICANKSSCSI